MKNELRGDENKYLAMTLEHQILRKLSLISSTPRLWELGNFLFEAAIVGSLSRFTRAPFFLFFIKENSLNMKSV